MANPERGEEKDPGQQSYMDVRRDELWETTGGPEASIDQIDAEVTERIMQELKELGLPENATVEEVQRAKQEKAGQ